MAATTPPPKFTCTVTKTVPAPESLPEDKASLKAHHVKNSAGETIKFQNPHPSVGQVFSFWGTLQKFATARLRGEMNPPSTTTTTIPSVTPSFLPLHSPPPSALRATWLGHACYFLEFPSGLRVLFDPVFEPRCSPLSFAGPKRYSAPGCAIADLPAVHLVVISHSHYDHLSHGTVVEIAKRFEGVHFLVGLGLEKWFRASGIERVTELDWWEGVEVTVKGDGGEIKAEVSALPCQHFSGRTGLDKDHTLWASWSVASGGKSAWFGGDTGYRAVPQLPEDVDDWGPEYADLPRCPEFEKIGRLRGPFDLGLIPIAAYSPRHLMSNVHANPYDAVEIFKDTQCKRAMGIHWGTWVLTTEPVEEPPRLLKEALKKSGIAETGVFDTCAIGESREF
ncbi:beta-lactamase superfamily domain-containing protein [Cercophora newfieldiana]|uniref:Beta-lactamase superfamily domain-containing protein n=1 Tax=Cercophora newfieldiana TaxID=92897 RepID=A0AA39Y115_9PEZI|nr:beta-lactamase superfamily domain-containing protein [Cercophora newfieldiana]